jgi:serine/threonine protein kinase
MLKKKYDIAKFIESKAPTIGIFPVDPLHCGVTAAEMGRNYTDIRAQCGSKTMGEKYSNKIRDKYNHMLHIKKLQEFYAERDALFKTWPDELFTFEDKKFMYETKEPITVEKIKKILAIKEPLLCAMQYPRYLYSFDDAKFQSLPVAQQERYFKDMHINMLIMHTQGIFHLDIKEQNMCVLREHEAKFADWGFAQYVSPTASAFDMYNIIGRITWGTLGYYEKLFPQHKSYVTNMNKTMYDVVSMYAKQLDELALQNMHNPEYRPQQVQGLKYLLHLVDLFLMLGVYTRMFNVTSYFYEYLNRCAKTIVLPFSI